MSLATRTGLAAGALVLFVLIVGPDPSVLRAGAMGGICLVALARGKSTEPLHLLGLAGIVVIATRPAMVFSIGLHLSAAATLGIILWIRPLEDRLGFMPRLLRVPLAATLAAQIAVTPLMVGVFGQLSVVAPVANLVAIPAVAPATVAPLAGGLVSLLFPSVGGLVTLVASPFASWILGAGNLFGGAGWASLDVPRGLGWPLGAAVLLAAARSLRSVGPRVSLRP